MFVLWLFMLATGPVPWSWPGMGRAATPSVPITTYGTGPVQYKNLKGNEQTVNYKIHVYCTQEQVTTIIIYTQTLKAQPILKSKSNVPLEKIYQIASKKDTDIPSTNTFFTWNETASLFIYIYTLSSLTPITSIWAASSAYRLSLHTHIHMSSV